MSAPAFTPGPWVFQRTTRQAGRGEGVRIIAQDGYVASVLSYSARPFEQKISDGHLIAAAPDLFDALAGLLDVTEELCFASDETRAAYVKAEAAFAKARGES